MALCEGPISGIGRIWADGKPLDLKDVTWRLYKGDEVQLPDPFIEARMGAGNVPSYRGTAYVMFEELPLEAFGNRIPQLSFEVFRPVVEPDTAEGMVRAVTLIPGTGEFLSGRFFLVLFSPMDGCRPNFLVLRTGLPISGRPAI